MTRIYLNTLYVGTEGAVCRLENDQVRVEVDGEKVIQVPLHHLGALCVFGRVLVTSPLIARFAETGRSLVLMTEFGRFLARVVGKTTGNVLLRKAQYDYHCDERRSLSFARSVVAGKLQNARQVLLRGARDAKEADKEPLLAAAEDQVKGLALLPGAQSLDWVRGVEGNAAQAYFDVFDRLITTQRMDFRFDGRSRRPPRDRMNALLSFLYSIWTNDCVAALEGVGLDPQFGILHALRPGRSSLALDMTEEFRSVVLDRLALTLVNRRELVASDFDVRSGESVMLTDDGRKKLLVAYQKRKQTDQHHSLLQERVPIGLLPHVQARIMARCFRGEVEDYVPYLAR